MTYKPSPYASGGKPANPVSRAPDAKPAVSNAQIRREAAHLEALAARSNLTPDGLDWYDDMTPAHQTPQQAPKPDWVDANAAYMRKQREKLFPETNTPPRMKRRRTRDDLVLDAVSFSIRAAVWTATAMTVAAIALVVLAGLSVYDMVANSPMH